MSHIAGATGGSPHVYRVRASNRISNLLFHRIRFASVRDLEVGHALGISVLLVTHGPRAPSA